MMSPQLIQKGCQKKDKKEDQASKVTTTTERNNTFLTNDVKKDTEENWTVKLYRLK